MSYDGPTANQWRINDVTRRFRMLLQGGVYLRTNLAIAGTTCTIGQDGADRNNGNDIPTEFFRNRDTPVLCALEQQTGSGASTLTTEPVSVSAIPAFAAATDGLEVTLATGPTVGFTTALNARIRLRTHPVTGSLPPPVVQQGYTRIHLDAEKPAVSDYNFPCLAVQVEVGYDPDFGGNMLIAESYMFTCTWMKRINADENIDEQLIDDTSTWMEMISHDNYLGGGVEWSEPSEGPTFEPDEDRRELFRQSGLDIIHFGVRANRGEIRNTLF